MPARAGRPRVAPHHHGARRARPVRRWPHCAGAGVCDVLALRRRRVAGAVLHGLPHMTVRRALATALLVLGLPRSAAACAVCIGSALGDRGHPGPYIRLILLPFIAAGGPPRPPPRAPRPRPP